MACERRGHFIILSGLLFTFFYTWSSIFSLASPWLEQTMGLDEEQRANFFTILSITALCMQPLYGFLQDKLGLRKHLLWILAFLLFASGPYVIFVASPLLKQHVFWGSLMLGIYVGATFNAGIGALESYTERVSRISNFEYGSARFWGSLGWAAATFFAGRLINIDPRWNFAMASGAAMVFIILLWRLRTTDASAFQIKNLPAPPKLSDALSLLAMPRFWALVIFVCGISVYNVYDQQFSNYYITFFSDTAGGTALGNEMYGNLNSFQVLLEACGMFLAPFLVNRIGAKNGLILSGLIMSTRILCSYLAFDPVTISLVKLLHAVELPILLIAMFKYITTRFDARLSSTLYLVAFQFILSIVASILSYASGKSYAVLGFANTYLLMGLTVLVLTLISGILLSGEEEDKTSLSLETGETL